MRFLGTTLFRLLFALCSFRCVTFRHSRHTAPQAVLHSGVHRKHEHSGVRRQRCRLAARHHPYTSRRTARIVYPAILEMPRRCVHGASQGRACLTAAHLRGTPRTWDARRRVRYVFFMIGTAAYNRYMSSWSYKSIWTFTQVRRAVPASCCSPSGVVLLFVPHLAASSPSLARPHFLTHPESPSARVSLQCIGRSNHLSPHLVTDQSPTAAAGVAGAGQPLGLCVGEALERQHGDFGQSVHDWRRGP